MTDTVAAIADPHTAARTYANLGWRVVPIKPGEKYPALKQWEDRASSVTETINHWWTRTHRGHGVGIATGAQSGIWVVDVDRTDAKDGYITLQTLVDQHGRLPKTLQAVTGTGGLHIYFKWNPEHEVRNSQGLSTPLGPGLDVRGEGGQVVAAPTIHPNGQPYAWAQDPTTTPIADAPAWIYALLERDPDQPKTLIPAGPDVAPERKRIRLDTPTSQPAEGHVESPAEWFKHNNSLTALLTLDGWTELTSRPGFWVRPGKDPRLGHSATVHDDEVLVIWSTAAPAALLAAGTPTKGNSGVSVSLFGYYAATRHGGDRSAAAAHIRGHIQTLQGTTPKARAALLPAATTGAIDALHDQPDPNLSATFWQSRPTLGHIRQAAHARGRSADAVLGTILARIAAHTPHNIVLPAIVGSHASLNVIHALVGPSGTGKTTSMEIAQNLLTLTGKTNLKTLADVPLGSGEGIAEAYFTMELEDTGETGGKGAPKKKTVKRQTIYAGLFISDEIDQLAQQAARSGATLMPTLRTAWSGGLLGQTNATEERKRRLPAHAYRFCLIVGVQPERAENLIDDAAGGTPQRFTWFSTLDPTIPAPADRPEWPGQISWSPPHLDQFERTHQVAKRNAGIIGVPDEIAEEIANNDYLRQIGERNADIGSSHRDLSRLKMAALLAILDERVTIDAQDWILSAEIVDASHTIYASMEQAIAVREAERIRSATAASLLRLAAEDSDKERRNFDRAVQAISRKAARVQPAELTRNDCINAMRSTLRKQVDVDDVLDEMVFVRHLLVTTESGWRVP